MQNYVIPEMAGVMDASRKAHKRRLRKCEHMMRRDESQFVRGRERTRVPLKNLRDSEHTREKKTW